MHSVKRDEISISVSTFSYRDWTRIIYFARNIPAFDIDSQNGLDEEAAIRNIA
jgi:hypothetical protein